MSITPLQSLSRDTGKTRWSLPALTLLLLGLAVLAVGAYVRPTLALALVVAVGVLAAAWRRPFLVFGAVLAFIPLYDGVVRVVTWQLQWPASWIRLLSLWKETAIVLLFAVILVQHVAGKRRLRWRLYPVDLWLAAVLLLAVAYVPIAARPGIGLFGLRNYLAPLALFYLARLLPYSRRELAGLLAVLALIAAGVAAFGIYQARFIDFPTMVAMGYVDETGNLPFAFKTALRDGVPIPRAISTATGPNQLAIYLNVFIVLSVYGILRWRQWGSRLLLAGLALILGLCLLFTYSRGGLLALIVSLLATTAIIVSERGLRRSWRELRQNRLLMAGLLCVIVLATIGVAASGFATRVVRGLTGRDPAADAHAVSMQYSLGFIAQHPLGIGMGMVGERALRFLGEADIQHTESTYLQFAMETGLLGLILLFALLTALLAALWRIRASLPARGDPGGWGQTLVEVAFVLWLGAMAVFIVTPLLQNLLAAGYLWAIAGMAFHLDAYE